MSKSETMVGRLNLFAFCFFFLSLGSLAQDDLGPRPELPDRVRWELPTPEQESAAAAKLRRLLAPGYQGDESFVTGNLILVDPRVWDGLRADPAISKLELKTLRCNLPRLVGTLSCEGRAFMGETKRHVESKIRQTVTDDGAFQVRRANGEEVDYVWALIPFDMDGTLLTVVTPKRRLLQLVDAKEEMLYLFEMPTRSMTPDEALESLRALPLTVCEVDEVEDRLDDPELPLPGVLDSDDIAVVLLTRQEWLAARIEKTALEAYADNVDALLMELVPKNAGRVLVQVIFSTETSPTFHVRLPKGAPPDLKARIAAVPLPSCRGPVNVVLVKDR